MIQASEPGREDKRAEDNSKGGPEQILLGLGCLTAMSGAILVVWATFCCLVRLARWALGW